MRSILLAGAILLMAAPPLFAQDMVARHPGGDTVRLTDKPCPEAVQKILTMLPERWRAAHAVVDGQQFTACWILRPDGQVLLRYEDGDAGLIPLMEFKPQPGI